MRGTRPVFGLRLFAHISLVLIVLAGATAMAANFQWSGQYNFEGVWIDNPSLEEDGSGKTYGLHHLILRPEIVAADGFYIYGRFDLLNNDMYPNSALGEVWGAGVRNAATAGGATNSVDDSNAASQHQEADFLAVKELYAMWTHQYGILYVGRMPLEFGLGVTYSAGRGPFDHWYDVYDAVTYRFQMGNFFIQPMIAKMDEGLIGHAGDDVSSYILQLHYAKPSGDLSIGVLYEVRTAPPDGNDWPAGALSDSGTSGFGVNGFETNQISVFARRQLGNMKVGVEAGFTDGDTGALDAANREISLNGYGVALELDWVPEDSKWSFGFRGGVASGDDPNTEDVFEGFIFDRNYNVATLLFNHVLGQGNLLRTGMVRNTALGAHQDFDTEAISNVFYISPRANYRMSERWGVETRLTTGFLNKDPLLTDVDANLGFEADLGFNFSPNDRITWVNEVALLFPGAAFEGGTMERDTGFTFGFVTKAAIRF